MQKSDGLLNGKHLAAPTVAETLQQSGFPTMIAGTKPVALLQDRARNRASEAGQKSVTLFAGRALPESALTPIVAAQGAFAAELDFPDLTHNTWTTRARVEQLWKDEVPKFSVLWMSEPDFSQHQTAPGAPLALAALRGIDENLATLLAALAARGVRKKTDVFVVSDHGFSTILWQNAVAAVFKNRLLRWPHLSRRGQRRSDLAVKSRLMRDPVFEENRND